MPKAILADARGKRDVREQLEAVITQLRSAHRTLEDLVDEMTTKEEEADG